MHCSKLLQELSAILSQFIIQPFAPKTMIFVNILCIFNGLALYSRVNPFCAGTYANRLDPGQPPSNSAAGLRSNLFATQSIIPNKK